jgi:hypothetical protein
MRQTPLLAVPLLLAVTPALADSGGNSALALAALVGLQSPLVNAADKKVLAYMLDGNLNFSYPANKKIIVKSDSVTCRASNVDISAHSCELTFGAKKPSTKGRGAHELFATLIENGVPGDGAAGSIFESVKALDCTIDPNAVKQRDGSGATCKFTPGQ